MPVTGYPNVSLISTTTTLHGTHDGAIIVSTYGSSVNIVVTSVIPAGFQCQIVQAGAGAVWVTAGSGATINSTGTAVATSAQYAVARLVAYTNGNVVITGNIA